MQESEQYKNLKIPPSEQRHALRSLMNLRLPYPLDGEFLSVQDEYLGEEVKRKGIVDWRELPTAREAYGSALHGADRITLWQGDITRLNTDAIVNAANSQMLGCFVPCHGCIDNAIHSAAGLGLREECARLMRRRGREEPAGEAEITGAYNLPSRYVLHTVGPIVAGRLTERHCELLRSCYESCLKLADEYRLESVAFCCISTGEYRFPNGRAAEIAVETVGRYLENSPLNRVVFNVFKDRDRELYRELLSR